MPTTKKRKPYSKLSKKEKAKRSAAATSRKKAAAKKTKVKVTGSGSSWRGNRTATSPVKKGKKGDLEHKRIISQSKKQMKSK